MMTFACWKWPSPAGYRTVFGPETVNVWADMIDRNYPHPHRNVCVTNQSAGIDTSVVEVVPDPGDFADLVSPSGGRNPSCYRRLRMFSRGIEKMLGPRFCWMDLDVVITGDLTPLVDGPEDFKMWGDTHPRTFYNGSLGVMNAGARPQVWDRFDPVHSPQASRAAGHFGSDQGWISQCLGPHEPKFTTDDGVYSFKNHLRQTGFKLPANARVVVFHGQYDPWMAVCQRIPWVRRHYRRTVSVQVDAPPPPVGRKIVACYFGEGYGLQYPRMARVLKYTAQLYCPGWEVEVAQLRDKPSLVKPSETSNLRKKAHWTDAVEASPDGTEIALLDADTMITNPLDSIWADPFDLAYTIKQGHMYPFNSGVVFLRVNDRTRAFMRAWLEATSAMLANTLDHQAWRRKYGGLSQAAFGYLLDTGRATDLRLLTVPCAEWNCEDSSWPSFDAMTTRIVHLKSLLRRVVFHMGPTVPKLKPLVQVWKRYEQQATARVA